LQTPAGLYRITARTSDTVVTITTPSTYTNETTVALGVWKRLFQGNTGSLTTATASLYNTLSVQPTYTIVATDKLASMMFGNVGVAAPVNISYVYGGSTQYTHFVTPLVIRHNDLSALQGGSGGEYYHLTSAEYTGTGTGNFVRATAPQISTIELGHASDTTLARVGAGQISVEGVNVVTTSSTDTLTNKRRQLRVYSTTSVATLTPEIATYDAFALTAQAEALTIANHSTSTPVDFEKMQIRILDNGTARAISFGTNYIASTDLALPTTTVIGKVIEMGFEWNSNKSKWVLVALLNNI
jgi:hypothetical protein